uniref:hypothetical protein n=1 Tax=Vaginimicrobium propionicum TaxID=1871034 RepID=UPI000970EE93|nr:hypothetical protein [Vaginimicrobium propionicum]
MSRKVNLPGASELFRDTKTGQAAGRRVDHDEKITVYISSQQLMTIEQARLRLKGEFGLRVDRGRLVREAVAIVLDELDKSGADSEIVQRLSQQVQ